MSVKYAVIFERAGNNWAAHVPDLPGCMSTGCTLEEAKMNIREAIQGHLETLREFGDPIPGPACLADEIEVTTSAWFGSNRERTSEVMATTPRAPIPLLRRRR